MCRVTMHQVELCSITSVELQKRIGIWDLDYYVGPRTLQWVSHVARMDKSRLPRRLLTARLREPRPEFGQKMSYGRSLEWWLKLFGLPLRYTEWATLAMTGPSGRASSPANACTNNLPRIINPCVLT